MRLAPGFVSGVLLALTACSEGPFGGEATVPEVIDNIHRWDGKIYHVEGWLGNCGDLDCAIYSTKADALLVGRASVSADYDDEWFAAMDRRLSIASMEGFDEQAEPFQFQQVVVVALISDYCRGWGRGCTDRAPDLIPFSIEPVGSQLKEE